MTEPTGEKKPAQGGLGQRKTASVGGLWGGVVGLCGRVEVEVYSVAKPGVDRVHIAFEVVGRL